MVIQSEKMLSVGGLAAGMAHEINNPLAGILQNLSVLENRLLTNIPSNQKAAQTAGLLMPSLKSYLELRRLPEMIDNIRSSATRAAGIVKNMLKFSRKSDGTKSNHDLCDLLNQTIELVKTDYDMKKNYDFKRIHITTAYELAEARVPCDPGKIQQVFMNVLINGAEAMSEAKLGLNPEFILSVKDDGAWVRVEIEDNGPGMDQKTLRKVFEPFFTTKPVDRGTGLGLSVSYFIISDDHGGEMWAEAGRSNGAKFVIRLPM